MDRKVYEDLLDKVGDQLPVGFPLNDLKAMLLSLVRVAHKGSEEAVWQEGYHWLRQASHNSRQSDCWLRWVWLCFFCNLGCACSCW